MSAPVALLALALVAAPQKLAVPEWKVINMPADLASFYAGEFARAMRGHGFDVMTAGDIRTLLGFERQKQLLGCNDEGTSCMAEMGAALGCGAIVMAELARLDDMYQGSVRILSATSGQTLAVESVRASGQRGLIDALEDAAARLARTLRPPPPPEPGGVRRAAWVPLVLGVALGGGAAACFGVSAGDFERIPSQSEPDAKVSAERGSALQVAGWSLAGVGAAALVTAGVMFLAGGAPPPVTPQVSVVNGGATVGLVGVLP